MLQDNLKILNSRISEAARRAGRNPKDITLVCVTKNIDTPTIEELISLGIKDIGENRIQEALNKFGVFQHRFNWHLVGHLQTNKAKKAALIFDLVHSLDSLDLAQSLNKAGQSTKRILNVLIQVNTAEEKTKFGLKVDKTVSFIKKSTSFKNLKILGLMTMAPIVKNPEQARPFFRRLRELKEVIIAKNIKNLEMRYLSMGMSHDFEVAIEEGANIIRVGTAIFKGA